MTIAQIVGIVFAIIAIVVLSFIGACACEDFTMGFLIFIVGIVAIFVLCNPNIPSERGENMKTCPKCGSTHIFKYRLDSDWFEGAGDYEMVNPESEYTPEEQKMDAFERPDLSLFHCRSCDAIWK